MKKELILKFNPNTIDLLGINMYSQIPSAIAEIIANSYDADATKVDIELWDNDPKNHWIRISDDGTGMSFEEINDNFLVIGRKKRNDINQSTKFGRKVTGRKGIGKLSLFGIGDLIRVVTTKEGTGKRIDFSLKHGEITQELDGNYKPEFYTSDVSKTERGTVTEVQYLKRKTKFNLEDTKISISKLFNFSDENFIVNISQNGGEREQISNKTRTLWSEYQFKWDVADVIKKLSPEYPYRESITGEIVSTSKPVKQGDKGITIYSRGRMVNKPDFFGASEAGHAASYISGWIDCDFLEDQTEDFTSTNRQEIIWDLPVTSDLHDVLNKMIKWIITDWGTKRSEEKEKVLKNRTGIDLEAWLKTVPNDVREQLMEVATEICSKHELGSESSQKIMSTIQKIVPKYPLLYWRHLHKKIKESCSEEYGKKLYFAAAKSALQKYSDEVRYCSKVKCNSDFELMRQSFGVDDRNDVSKETKVTSSEVIANSRRLVVTNGYRCLNEENFRDKLLENIEKGQQLLSMGVVMGCRNIVNHSQKEDTNSCGLFTENDCLDYLSILSHLFRRLDNTKESKERRKSEKQNKK